MSKDPTSKLGNCFSNSRAVFKISIEFALLAKIGGCSACTACTASYCMKNTEKRAKKLKLRDNIDFRVTKLLEPPEKIFLDFPRFSDTKSYWEDTSRKGLFMTYN